MRSLGRIELYWRGRSNLLPKFFSVVDYGDDAFINRMKYVQDICPVNGGNAVVAS